jgi:hypothetical protein
MFQKRKTTDTSERRGPAGTPAAKNQTGASMLRKRGHEGRVAAPASTKPATKSEHIASADLGYTHADREYREMFLGVSGLKKARGEVLVACLAIGYAVFRMLETRMTGAAGGGSTAVEVAFGIGAALLGLAIYRCSAAKRRR